MRALARFGAPLVAVSEVDFATAGIVFQIGNNPRRIDILTSISGVDFQQAYDRKTLIELEGISVPVISIEDLITNKRATGRTQDLADIEKLEGSPQFPTRT
jgi:predicted nucleotidyltransferase